MKASAASLATESTEATAEHRSVAWRQVVAAVIVLLFSSRAAVAEDRVGDPMTLDQLVANAQRDNKDLRAARYAVDIARARLVQAGALPNPRVNVGTSSDVTFNNAGAYSASVGVSQDFPIAGRLLRQKEVARVDIALAEAEIEDAERRLAGDVAAGVYRLLVIERQILARDALSAVDERLATATRNRFKAAEVSELDVNAVGLDLQRLNLERALLATQRSVLLQSLNRLLGQSSDAALLVVEPIPAIEAPPALAALLSKAQSQRPDLRAAQLQIDRAEAQIELAKAKRWEDWNVGVGIQQDRLTIDGAPSQRADRELALSVSIPIPLKSRNRGLLAEAQAAAREARARRDALALAVRSEIAAAHAEATSLQMLVNQYEAGLLPIAERNVGLAEKGYGEGLIPIVELVQAQRQQSELKMAALATLDQYLLALSRLHTATGNYPLLVDVAP